MNKTITVKIRGGPTFDIRTGIASADEYQKAMAWLESKMRFNGLIEDPASPGSFYAAGMIVTVTVTDAP